MALDDSRLKAIIDTMGCWEDFPKPGIIFRDIFPVLRKPEVFENLICLLLDHIKSLGVKVDAIVGLEARGFLLGTPLALRLGCPFVPIRKKGKLPGPCVNIEYSLEYGTDCFEMQENSITSGANIVIVDDLLATGGTMEAACKLIGKMGGHVTECVVVIELVDLKGKDRIKDKFFSLITYEGH